MADFEPTVEQTAGLAHQLADIARMLLIPATVDELLQRIVELATRFIDGCDEAGICEVIGGPSRTRPTSLLVSELDRVQDELGEGPCWDVLTVDSVHVADMQDCTAWARFAPQAVASGLRTVLAFQLVDGSETVGALQMYGQLPDAINDDDRAQAQIMAGYAGIALGIAQRADTEREKRENLQQALIYRDIVGQAQGILMERERVTGPQAFALLRQASQRLNVKLRDVAQELVDTGLLASPGASRSPDASTPPS